MHGSMTNWNKTKYSGLEVGLTGAVSVLEGTKMIRVDQDEPFFFLRIYGMLSGVDGIL